MTPSSKPKPICMNPEKVAYWYLRLNGFLQIEDFYVHPTTRGSARTDADLLAVRFPHRAERFYDDPDDIMKDDVDRLELSGKQIDVVIAEVKTGRCALNGPWTDEDRENVQRVLAAIGCIPRDKINGAAEDIYSTGIHEDEQRLRIRLVAIGREENEKLRSEFPKVTQVIWSNILGFIYDRHQKFKNQKKQTTHWDWTGKMLKKRATERGSTREEFIHWANASIEEWVRVLNQPRGARSGRCS